MATAQRPSRRASLGTLLDQHAPRLIAFAIALVAGSAPSVHADPRSQAITVSTNYANESYTVTSANVYPQASCYTSSDHEKVGIGSWQGVPYAYCHWHSLDQFRTKLANGFGAGNSKMLCSNNSSCVLAHITGIDCSGLISRSWGLSQRYYTGSLQDITDHVDPVKMKKADIYNKVGSHVVEFVQFLGPESGQVGHTLEATGTVTNPYDGTGRVVFVYSRDLTQLTGAGYDPRVYEGYKDDPDACLLWMGADATSGTVAWETGREKGSRGFRIYRVLPNEELQSVGDLVPARGIGDGPTRYEVVVPRSGDRETLRLEEIDTNGARQWLGAASWKDGIPQLPRTEQVTVSDHTVPDLPISQTCTIDGDPAKTNLSWIAICDAAWVDDLQPLIDYRNAHGLRAGVWTYQELTACGGKTKENIRDRLLWALQTWALKPRYVLLVGDADYRGPGYAEDLLSMWSQPNEELGGFWDDSIWGDRPYADPDGDGDVDLFVGRMPASFDAEVANGVQHILAWENAADPTNGSKALSLVEDSGYGDNDPAFVRDLADSVNSFLPGSWTTTSLVQSQMGGTYPDFEAACTSAWNSGQGLVFNFGNASGWWNLNSFMNTCLGWSASKLAATGYLPFVFSGSCLVGGFDREWETCFSSPVIEHLLVGLPNRGAAGALAPTRVVHPYVSAQLAIHFLQRVLAGEVSMGEAAYHAMDDLLAEVPGASDHVYEYVFLGDPAMHSFGPVPTGVPERDEKRFAVLGVHRASDGQGTVMEFALPGEEEVTIFIYDVAGRLLTTSRVQGFAGPQEWRWDERSSGGEKVASGMYFMQVRSQFGSVSGRVAIVR